MILVASLFIATASRRILEKYIELAKKTRFKLDERLLNIIKRPLYFTIITLGIYLALLQVQVLSRFASIFSSVERIIIIIIGTYVTIKVVKILEDWYLTKVLDKRFIPAVDKAINIFIYAIALIVILDQLNIEVTPLIASLGVATLAIGLALQETLSNFFAGLYIFTDKPVRLGDYIELDTGDKGYVEDVGWRSTRIKTLPNNIIVIPNSKLAQSRIINYYLPQEEMAVVVQCGVSYFSDLEKVERVTVEVAREIQRNVQGAIKNFEPFIRYHTFGDSNINFSIILRVEKFVDQYLVVHELVKKIHNRFREEGIEISFPARTVYHPKGGDRGG